jgi:hypothetical protein
MAGLKEVTVWADPEKFEPWHYGWDAYESLLCWLEYLKGRRVDMEVHVKGTLREVWGSTNVNRMWVWKHEGGEGKWLERI